MKINKIIFDMDGVLVDLSKNLARLDGYEDPALWLLHKTELDGHLSYVKSIARHIDNKCFLTCDPMPNHEKMLKLMHSLHYRGFEISILSSCMKHDFSEKIKRQKIDWLFKYYRSMFNSFSEINIVEGSSLKIDYVDKDSILIDDYLKTQKTFIENDMGDNFIAYKNFDDLIDQLTQKQII